MKNITYKFVQWSSPEELHEACLQWKSELEFFKKEQQFLDELIKANMPQLLSEELYKKTTDLISELSKEEKEVTKLLKRVRSHINLIEILVDGIDEIEKEKSFKEAHYYLKIEVAKYAKDFRATKTAIFELIKAIMKQRKQKKIAKN